VLGFRGIEEKKNNLAVGRSYLERGCIRSLSGQIYSGVKSEQAEQNSA
jgi:hypothetical protein